MSDMDYENMARSFWGSVSFINLLVMFVFCKKKYL
jgi:hypothetical protein